MNYQNGKIYRIDCLTTNEVYIGSTCQPTVAKRLAKHICDYKYWKKGKGNFVSSYPIIERENYKISLIELFPCNSKDELSAREGHFIRTINCVNKYIAGQTRKEYLETHKDKIKEYLEENREKILEQTKEYREKNREKIREKNNIKNNCDCGGKYTTANKATHFKSKKHLSLSPEQILSVEAP